MKERLNRPNLHTKLLLSTSIVGLAVLAAELPSEHPDSSSIPDCATNRFPLPEEAKVGTSLTLTNGVIVVINEKPVIDFVNPEKPPVGVVYGTNINDRLDVTSVTADCSYAGGSYTADPIRLP